MRGLQSEAPSLKRIDIMARKEIPAGTIVVNVTEEVRYYKTFENVDDLRHVAEMLMHGGIDEASTLGVNYPNDVSGGEVTDFSFSVKQEDGSFKDLDLTKEFAQCPVCEDSLLPKSGEIKCVKCGNEICEYCFSEFDGEIVCEDCPLD
jgi:hypothetical protein